MYYWLAAFLCQYGVDVMLTILRNPQLDGCFDLSRVSVLGINLDTLVTIKTYVSILLHSVHLSMINAPSSLWSTVRPPTFLLNIPHT